MTFFAGESNKEGMASYLSRHVTEVEKKQFADVKDAHRRHITALKTEYSTELHRVQGNLHVANAKWDRLNTNYNWICTDYEEQMRVNQEQEDRIQYLEDERKQNGLSTPKTRLPFSAPASQIEFSDPTLRSRFRSAVKGSVTDMPFPLGQVSDVSCIATVASY
tara:strand:+ start:26664 stop:27152 length:489 start_codon:yes stop_codon:yes gene_type:complete